MRDFNRRLRVGAFATLALCWLFGTAGAQSLPFCGDGVVEGAEECDDGNQRSNDGCSKQCDIESFVCGDGVVEGTEQCDDGNLVNLDGCDDHCSLEHGGGGECGDGIVNVANGEQCDDGNHVGGDFCGPTCLLEYCSNGYLDVALGEECDDGNFIPADGCSPTCTIQDPSPYCGNGIFDPGELCDDGNFVAGDGCSPTCVPEYCGNGIIDPGEACDDGNFASGDGCSNTCVSEYECGNGVVEGAEECDAGAQNVCNFGCCNESCLCPRCGDGVVQALDCPDCPSHAPEQCDDGNAAAGDGCSASCQIELCGNNVIDAGEQCDDGNATSGDGCSGSCQIEGDPNCCSDEGGKPTFMEVRFTHPAVAGATSITVDHGRKCDDFKAKFVSDTETWTGAVPVDANDPSKPTDSDLAITAVAGQTVTLTISGTNKLNSNSSFKVKVGADEFAGCIHTSCSQPLYVGQVFGTYYEVTALSGANVDSDNPFCQ